jgi:hypothetical protein
MKSLLIRHVVRGRVVFALPTVVAGDGERLATWTPPGTPIAYPLGRANGRLLPFDEWGVELRSWIGPGRLELTPIERQHAIRLVFGEDGSFLGWYVNIQAPLEKSRFGFDTTDWQLDLWIEADGTVHWKDEEDLARAVELEIMRAEEARLAHQEAERVLDEWPFPTGWEDWRPSARTTRLTLPDSWDVV